MNTWQQLLDRPGPLLADGAMGTQLFQAGLMSGDSPELWNVLYPERVRAIQRRYIDAGADVILTNTFGGTRFRLKLHNLQDRVAELNRAGVELLRAEIAASGRAVLAAGDLGPSGEILEPLGALTYAEAVAGFAEQAQALVAAGADLLWIETMSSLDEIHAALEGARQASATIPIVTTMSFDTHGRTMMGVTPEQALQALTGWGAAAVGANCGNGTDELLAAIQRFQAAGPTVPLVAKSNAGMPELIQGKVTYRATPEQMAVYARQARAAGARLIGACCGSTPDHIRAMAQALREDPGGDAGPTAGPARSEPVVGDAEARVQDRAARRQARAARQGGEGGEKPTVE